MLAPSVRNQTDYTKHRGVRHTNSGKWGAAIRHPITKVSVWLGSYNTPKEAADAYIKKKLVFDSLVADAFIKTKREFDSMVADAYIKKKLEFDCNATAQKAEEALSRKSCEAKVMDQAEIKCEESHVHITENVKARSVGTRSVDNSDAANHLRRSRGSGFVYQNNAGRWRSYISIGKTKVCVGTFTTREEAEAALCKKRLDLDSMSPVVAAVAKELDPECGFERTRNLKKPLCESLNGQITCSKPRGVYQRKSGKWYSEIINPMTKVKHKVGSYETAQEALDALNRKRCEYAEMKKHKQSNVETELISETGISDVKIAHMDGECGGSQMNVDNIEVPCSSIVSNENFDLGIINAFGELVGELCWQDLNYMSPFEVAVSKELDPVCGFKRTRKHEMALSETSNGQITCSRPHGVYQRKSGKWFAEIINPITKVKRCVSSYETAQEALDALNRKRRGYAEEKHKQSNVETELVSEARISKVKVEDTDNECAGSQVNVDSIQVPCSSVVSNENFDMGVINACGELVGEFSKKDLDSKSSVEAAVAKELDPECGFKRSSHLKKPLSESLNGQITCNRPRGVYQRKSGKWFAEIINPVTKVKRKVGSYETAQEALDAVNRKRREYAEMKKHKQSNVETELVSECQDIVYEAGISDVKVADIDVEGGGSRVSAGSVQLPLSSFVSNQDDEFGMSSVINCYGELVGEFSRLDDELWLDV